MTIITKHAGRNNHNITPKLLDAYYSATLNLITRYSAGENLNVRYKATETDDGIDLNHWDDSDLGEVKKAFEELKNAAVEEVKSVQSMKNIGLPLYPLSENIPEAAELIEHVKKTKDLLAAGNRIIAAIEENNVDLLAEWAMKFNAIFEEASEENRRTW